VTKTTFAAFFALASATPAVAQDAWVPPVDAPVLQQVPLYNAQQAILAELLKIQIASLATQTRILQLLATHEVLAADAQHKTR
jgi:hypothetical protein